MAFPDDFSTARLRAERLAQGHLPDLRRLQSNPDVMAHLGGVRTEEQTEAYVARNLLHWAEHGFGLWVLREVGGQEVIGLAVLRHLLVDGVDEVEVGYSLHPRFWGRGFATEVATACLTYAREELGLTSIVAVTDPGNLGSHRVLLKAGLVYDREFTLDGAQRWLFRTRAPSGERSASPDRAGM